MAPHSSTLAWKTPWLQSMGSLSRTRLSNFTFTFHFHALEKKMATHSSVLAWRIPGTGEPGGLQSMGVAQSWTRLKWRSSSSSSTMLTHLRTKVKIQQNCTWPAPHLDHADLIYYSPTTITSLTVPQTHWTYSHFKAFEFALNKLFLLISTRPAPLTSLWSLL